MERDEFAKVMQEVIDSLPEEFRSRISNVAVLVEDFPPGQSQSQTQGYCSNPLTTQLTFVRRHIHPLRKGAIGIPHLDIKVESTIPFRTQCISNAVLQADRSKVGRRTKTPS